jgi:hypothetical protein
MFFHAICHGLIPCRNYDVLYLLSVIFVLDFEGFSSKSSLYGRLELIISSGIVLNFSRYFFRFAVVSIYLGGISVVFVYNITVTTEK